MQRIGTGAMGLWLLILFCNVDVPQLLCVDRSGASVVFLSLFLFVYCFCFFFSFSLFTFSLQEEQWCIVNVVMSRNNTPVVHKPQFLFCFNFSQKFKSLVFMNAELSFLYRSSMNKWISGHQKISVDKPPHSMYIMLIWIKGWRKSLLIVLIPEIL